VAVTKADKREQKIRENTKNVSLEDFEWLICRYGHIKAGGSHSIAVFGNRQYPYKRSNPVDQPYTKKLIQIIDQEVK
jgi:hypothetical protein